MSAGALCGVAPFFFRNKQTNRHGKASKGKSKGSIGCGVAGIFATMTELRNKISILRDLLDFSPCVASASLNELLISTINDLSKRYPKIERSEIKDVPMHKALKLFCDTLKSLGDMWTNEEEWMVRSKYEPSMKFEHFDLEQMALRLLEDIIKIARERFFDETDEEDDEEEEEEEDMSDYSSRRSNVFGKALSEAYSDSPSASPLTPTSVLSEAWKSSKTREKGSSYSPPMQAIEKLNPIDIKRLSFHMLPHATKKDKADHCQESQRMSQAKPDDDEVVMSNMETQDQEEFDVGKMDEIARKLIAQQKFSTPVVPSKDVITQTPEQLVPPPASNKVVPPSLPPPTNLSSPVTPPPPPPPPQKVVAPPPPLPKQPTNKVASPPPPPPPLPPPQNVAAPPIAMRNSAPPTPPSSPTSISRGPPPPPSSNRRGPPPPPGFAQLRAKKFVSKLKRSPQMGNMYRVLKGKVEGSSLNGKPTGGRKPKPGASPSGGKLGMADALAEMTKRSAYFQQIEEDVKNYERAIKDLKIKITTFETSDMNELLKFHKYVESHLELLTDETQVLARFEDFPAKKLEAVRMAAALYSKLDSIATTLRRWPAASPVGQLLDKTESYFNKIKVEMDALERTKDEELKKFKSQKINFDFGVLVRIKESMVDVSSNCMELALKEKGEALAKENKHPKCAKMLWKVFQFAFRVYTFAGGHDDRADKLTREIAGEIEKEH